MRKCFITAFLFCGGQNIFAQNVGIGTTAPTARLHVADSSVLFSGPASLPSSPGLPPISGAGTRMMWYSTKAAFRAGGTTNTSWNEAFVGNYSTAFGLSNRASGLYSTSTGWGNSSSGVASFSSGYSTTASGNYSAVFGEQADAQAYGSLVIGRYNLQEGSGTAWVNTDPLFVVGNGYVYQISPGIGAIQRRNAFLIDKLGNTTVGGKMDITGAMDVKGDANFENGVGINLTASQTLNTSLSVNGAVALKSSSQTISLAGDYIVETQNVGFVKLHYNESASLNPVIKLNYGSDGQVLLIQHAGEYPFKIYGGINYPGFPIVRLSALSHTLKKFDTLVLIYSAGTGWLQISYSPYN